MVNITCSFFFDEYLIRRSKPIRYANSLASQVLIQFSLNDTLHALLEPFPSKKILHRYNPFGKPIDTTFLQHIQSQFHFVPIK
jgi:hypothetical protein